MTTAPAGGRRRYEDEPDATGGLIPYKNAMALTAYYLSVFSLIPCVGSLLGPAAVICGFLGLKHANKHPNASGKAHAVVGIVLGGITTLLYVVAPIVFFGAGMAGAFK